MDRTRDPKRNIPEFPTTTILFYQDFIAGDKMNKQEYNNSKISRKNPEHKKCANY